MQRRRGLWLVFAVVLFGLAAWLMLSGQGEEEAPPPPKVAFPNRLRPQERERMEKRRTYVLPVVDAGTAVEQKPVRPRDPVLAALPRGKGKTAMVIEANAIRHSPIGELLLECLMNRGGEDLARFKQETGVDPLQDLDRLVITDDGVIVSGNFGDKRLKDLLSSRGSTNYDYGDEARLFEPQFERNLPDGGVARRRGPQVGLWNDQMLVFGRSPDRVKEVIDRVEGRGPDEPPVISEGSTYGEMYGVISVEQLKKMFPSEQQELAAKLAEVAENVELHVDASSDFAMTAQVTGPNADKVTDLGKSLGGALSLARMKAQAEGEKELAQLLDFAKVRPDGDEFKLELAVPLEVIKQQLAFCREQQNAQSENPQEASPTP
ncbi:hypothetical protein [Vitiosangium sp. GDMCC 1.1324]|uniref:hypothetical protein n=1 Tax=Vitiosangium sp. (strain GDMCC 1.1324) TaxID=2138576 RepID=UPI000D35F396|nr:hypothetical protein [Vitiosangium sp. GDMCC 1.1324]PTL85368.1 hypothetical protein DAT35_01215 [Vitiosangium sp. GDMCC 1.1324]